MLAQNIAMVGDGSNSQDYLEKIFAVVSDAVLITNSSGKIEKINGATVELFGYQETELIGHKLSLIFAKQARARNLLPRILLSQNDVEIVCETKTGEKLELAFSFTPIAPDNEDTPDFICIGRDITSVKQLETRLQQKEKRDRLLGWLTQQILFSSNLEEILNRSSVEVRQFFACSRVLIYQFESHIVAQSHEDDTTNLPEQVAHSLYAEQSDIYVLEDLAVAELEQEYGEYLTQFQVGAELVVPIWHGEKLWGVLVAHQCGSSRKWEQWEIDTMGNLPPSLVLLLK